MPPDFIVLIATAGRPELLARTLGSLAACDRPGNFGGTVVVENGPPRGAERIVARFAGPLAARYLHVEAANKSLALNHALGTIGDALVYFTDDDVRLAPRTLTALARAAAARDRTHFFGGPVGVDYDVRPAPWLIEHLPASARGWSLPGGEQPTDLPFLGINWAAHAGAIRQAGGFSARVGPGARSGSVGQDTDMQMRLRAQGGRGIYVPGAEVWHYVPRERCTRAWTIARAYRHGMHRGMLEYDASVPLTLGYPRWTHAELIRRIVRRMIAALGTRRTAFAARHALSDLRGYRAGWREGRKRG